MNRFRSKVLYLLESGAKLACGQCQTLGIVSAFYKNPLVIILYEDASFLNEQTEELIMKDLFNNISKKTIISIYHRAESLIYCSRFIEFKDNIIKEKVN